MWRVLRVESGVIACGCVLGVLVCSGDVARSFSTHTWLSLRVNGLTRAEGARGRLSGSGGQVLSRVRHNLVQSLVRHVFVLRTLLCVALEWLRAVVCLLGCPHLDGGRCAESPHIGLSQRAFLEGDTPARARSAQWTCRATSRDPEPPFFFLPVKNFSEANDWSRQFPPLHPPCGPLLSLCHPVTSDECEDPLFRDTAHFLESGWSSLNILNHCA